MTPTADLSHPIRATHAAQLLVDLAGLSGHPGLATVRDSTTGELSRAALAMRVHSLADDWPGWSHGEHELLAVLVHLVDGRPFTINFAAVDARCRAAVVYALAHRYGVPITDPVSRG